MYRSIDSLQLTGHDLDAQLSMQGPPVSRAKHQVKASVEDSRDRIISRHKSAEG